MGRDLPYVNVPDSKLLTLCTSCLSLLLCLTPLPSGLSLHSTELLHFLCVSCGQWCRYPPGCPTGSKLAYGSPYKLHSCMYLCGCGHVCADLKSSRQCGLAVHHVDPTEALRASAWAADIFTQSSLPGSHPRLFVQSLHPLCQERWFIWGHMPRFSECI